MRIKIKVENIIYVDEYESIDEIESEFYDNVIYINCHNHKLENVEFIKKFPRLKTLIASNNLLTSIPDHNRLEILDVNTNKITQLGAYPKLLKLYAFNNLITVYNVPLTVFELDLSNNRLKKLNFNRNQIFSLFNIKYNNIKTKKEKTGCLFEKYNLNLQTIYE